MRAAAAKALLGHGAGVRNAWLSAASHQVFFLQGLTQSVTFSCTIGLQRWSGSRAEGHPGLVGTVLVCELLGRNSQQKKGIIATGKARNFYLKFPTPILTEETRLKSVFSLGYRVQGDGAVL